MAHAVFAKDETPGRTRPAAPFPASQPLGFRKAFRAARENPITVFPEGAYREPIFLIRRLGRTMAVVNDPPSVVRILVDNAANYRKSPQQQRRIEPALRQGLLTAEGDVWRSGRRIAAPLFSPKAVALLRADMQHAADATVARWEVLPDGERLDLAQEFQRLTYDIVSRTVFSGALDDERVRVRATMGEYFETIGRIDLASFLNLPDWVPTLGHARARSTTKVFRGIVTRAVADRTKAGAGGAGDLLDRLLSAKDASDGKPMPVETVLDNVLTFLAAGHETTGNALAWIAYLLATFPSADERLLAELRDVLGDRMVTPADFDALPFTAALIDEAMRLYPPAPFLGREAIAADALCGQEIAAGTQILVSPWLIHRHHRLWDEPDLFAPERFLPEHRRIIERGAYIPFGLGPRICIGQAFALQEIKVVLATIMRRFRFELPAGAEVVPQSRITLYPRGGLAMLVRRR